ncbi:MAG: HAD family hydrolase [Synechococcaceae cyanobacterium]|nr:HAD family hydrolase [Synechococcaceae cyanobacterium]
MSHAPGQRRLALERQLGGDLPDPARLELVLVTDLDGTLLAGSRRSRRRFYRWLSLRRKRVLHVFSTGRHLRSVERLLSRETALGLVSPHLVISDVGCTVACGTTLQPLPLVVEPIEALWRGCDARVRPLLEGLRGLSAQPVAVERRLGYLIEPDRLDLSRLAAVEAHGVDCLISAGRYLDVLPLGVNKGSTLLNLLHWLELDHDRVVTAGDSLNDLAMFQTGLQGVVVGNAEPQLLAAVQELPGIHLARAHGCAGIVEGLRQFGFAPLLEGYL